MLPCFEAHQYHQFNSYSIALCNFVLQKLQTYFQLQVMSAASKPTPIDSYFLKSSLKKQHQEKVFFDIFCHFLSPGKQDKSYNERRGEYQSK